MADNEPTTPDQPQQQPDPYGGYAPPPPFGRRAEFGAGGQPGAPAQFGAGTQFGTPIGYLPPPHPAAEPGPAPERSRHSGRRVLLAAAAVAAIVGGGVGAGTAALIDGGGSGTSSAGLTFTTQAAPAKKLDGSITAAAAKIGPSVVTINVTTAQEQDTGSGVIIREDGYILTNNHVIAAAAGTSGRISVALADGKVLPGTIVGQDPSDDLAVVKVQASGLTAATFASSADLKVGQTVVAVGAPLGLSDTVTAGIVSNTARPVQTGDDPNNQAVFNAVQTDAAINPGNSGGPLVNLNGDVVGINTAIATDRSSGGLQVPGEQDQAGNIGIGFAIPSDEASRIAGELISTGKATHAIMGVTVQQARNQLGAEIRSVSPGSPAAKAGLKAGDVVTKVDDQRITNADDLVAAIRSHAPAQKVAISYQRSGSSHTATITLGEAPS